MRVAGLGFTRRATVNSLRDALSRLGGPVDVVATLDEKASEPAMQQLCGELGQQVLAVSLEAIRAQVTLTRSMRVVARYGTGSISEAAALAAAGPGAQLTGPRVCSGDGQATAAIAERAET